MPRAGEDEDELVDGLTKTQRSKSSSKYLPNLRRGDPVSRLGPNGLKIDKETTHDLLSWRRRASMA